MSETLFAASLSADENCPSMSSTPLRASAIFASAPTILASASAAWPAMVSTEGVTGVGLDSLDSVIWRFLLLAVLARVETLASTATLSHVHEPHYLLVSMSSSTLVIVPATEKIAMGVSRQFFSWRPITEMCQRTLDIYVDEI